MKQHTEQELRKIIKKIITENSVNEALGGGNDMSSIDRLKSRYPNGFQVPSTITASGSNTFKNGVYEINTNSPSIKEIVSTVSGLVKNCGGPVTVIVNGSASAVGNSQGYDNKGLATQRRDALMKYLKGLNLSNVTFTAGAATVGKATVKDSPQAEKEQNVSATISCKGKMNATVTGVQGDNTNVEINQYNKKGPKVDPEILDTTVKYKRVCVKIPAGMVKEFQVKIREFKQEKGLSTIPFGVYDI